MVYDRHPELQSKWDKSFWARGYYVSTIGNITEDAIKKYIQEQSEESRKEENRSTFYRGPVTKFGIPAFQASTQSTLIKANCFANAIERIAQASNRKADLQTDVLLELKEALTNIQISFEKKKAV